jgi:hypothetical protein
MLRTFADHILTGQPVFWTTHVGGHPPGAFLVFIGLDRLGLTGGGWARVFCVLVGASAGPAVAVTLRVLGPAGGWGAPGRGLAGRVSGEQLARQVLPFAVLAPGAVWVGVSAYGMFTGVLAWAAALLAVGAVGRGRRADLACLGGGVLGGYCLYLSYGLALGGLVPLAVLAVARRARAAVLAVAGALAVAAAFTAAGFWWFTGYRMITIIYNRSIAEDRPYEYWWADLAALMFLLGPAVLAGMRRALTHPRALPVAVAALVGAAVLAIALADTSGMSKGEVERIWLPFAAWLVPVCAPAAGAPGARLAGRPGSARLAVNHLLLTVW